MLNRSFLLASILLLGLDTPARAIAEQDPQIVPERQDRSTTLALQPQRKPLPSTKPEKPNENRATIKRI